MAYKVFFVEDEIVTREGIRDNVDWQACGFEFCGQAADGEMALPLLRTARPDVLITDIKMPFMDGLQLSKLVRERMPWVKIIILSGHDEFEYAQEAIKLGVTDYLLKPITVEKMKSTLLKLAALLDQEREEQRNLQKLQEQVEENRAALYERLLLKLVVGAIPPAEAIEKAHLLGFDLAASYYQVVILKIELRDRSDQFDYDEYLRVQESVARLAEHNPDLLLLKKDFEDLILIIKGATVENLQEELDLFLYRINEEISATRYDLRTTVGTVQTRIADIRQSFTSALVEYQQAETDRSIDSDRILEQADLIQAERSAFDEYLRSGTRDQFDAFFDEHLLPLAESASKSSLIRNYLFVDAVLAAGRLVSDLGGDIETVLPEMKSIESLLNKIHTSENLRVETRSIFFNVLAYRDSLSSGPYKPLVKQAREYIDQNFSDPELSLQDVASHFNLSPSHFSAVFAHDNSHTFKEYLTETRIRKAKELLRTTSLRASEIAFQVGYNDPHYFSAVFKKHTGLSPIEFRKQI